VKKTEHHKIQRSMILCAGLGTRMQPLTLSTPKPLIKVAGKPLVEYGVDNLEKVGVNSIIINVHYLAEQVESWAQHHQGAKILISDERQQLLETGGGVCHATRLLKKDPVFVLNSDSFWLDRPNKSSLNEMVKLFSQYDCDFLLMLTPHKNAVGFSGAGDFFCDTNGAIARRGDAETAPFIYAGCYLMNPTILKNCPLGKFSMNILWDRSIKQNRVMGYVHDGLWLHVGTPDAIKLAEDAISTFDHDPL